MQKHFGIFRAQKTSNVSPRGVSFGDPAHPELIAVKEVDTAAEEELEKIMQRDRDAASGLLGPEKAYFYFILPVYTPSPPGSSKTV